MIKCCQWKHNAPMQLKNQIGEKEKLIKRLNHYFFIDFIACIAEKKIDNNNKQGLHAMF